MIISRALVLLVILAQSLFVLADGPGGYESPAAKGGSMVTVCCVCVDPVYQWDARLSLERHYFG